MLLECAQNALRLLPKRSRNAPRTPPDRPQNAPSTYPDALAMRSQCAYNALAMRSQCVAWRRSRPVVHKKTLRPPWKSSAVFRPLPIGRRPRLHPSRLFFELSCKDPRASSYKYAITSEWVHSIARRCALARSRSRCRDRPG
jgi:hypothetical protein